MNISYKRQNRAHEVGAKDRGDAGTDSTESSGMKKKKKQAEKEIAREEKGRGTERRTEMKGDTK